MIDLRHDENPLEMRRLMMIRPPANGCDMCPAALKLKGWIAPQTAESKARERACGAKSCLWHDPEKWIPVSSRQTPDVCAEIMPKKAAGSG
jgi:hypothetical protein